MEKIQFVDDSLLEGFLCGSKECFHRIVRIKEIKTWNAMVALSPTLQDLCSLRWRLLADLYLYLSKDRLDTPLLDWFNQRSLDLSVERLVKAKANGQSFCGVSDCAETEEEETPFLDSTVIADLAADMPFELQKVFMFCDVLSLKPQETGAIVALSTAHVDDRLRQARGILREALREHLLLDAGGAAEYTAA